MSQENVGKPEAGETSSGDVAFALLLIGGILISVGSLVGVGLTAIGRPYSSGELGMMGVTMVIRI